jgi:hypothetical protein
MAAFSSFRCDAQFCPLSGHSRLWQADRPRDLWVHGLGELPRDGRPRLPLQFVGVSFRLRYADGNMPPIYLASVPKPTISGFVLLTVSGIDCWSALRCVMDSDLPFAPIERQAKAWARNRALYRTARHPRAGKVGEWKARLFCVWMNRQQSRFLMCCRCLGKGL